VPVEETTLTNDTLIVSENFDAVPGRYIHRAGSDAREGEALLNAGILLGSREIGVAASCGADVLEVSRLPRIAIFPTGDELVSVDETPAPHQIRQSNGHAIRAALERCGYAATLSTPLRDDASADALRDALENHDLLIFTGAVSKGSRDFLPRLFGELGCARIFHGVAQRPGKPAGFWQGPRQQLIIALPGNPVSAITGLHAFVLPALAVAAGLSIPKPRLVIPAAPFNALPDMMLHLPVSLDDTGRAHPAATGNSGDFIGLLKSDGFVTIPPRGAMQAAFSYTPWR
jgi:molybdopterin molybdotransferase